MILLDTHVLLWLDSGSDRIGPKSREVADRALASDVLAVSAITFWEVAMLAQRGRIRLDPSPASWRRELLAAGLVEITVDGAVGLAAAGLEDLHGDPADRMIVATAELHGATLLTADQRLLSWSGRLARLDAAR